MSDIPTRQDQLELSRQSDQSMSGDEIMFRGLYLGSTLPSVLNIINDTSIFPRSSSLLFNSVISFKGEFSDRVKETIPVVLKHDDIGHKVEYDGINYNIIAELYRWALYSGAPLAVDNGDTVVIHDDPRKLHPSISKNYNASLGECLRMRIISPFHCWRLDSNMIRRFVPFEFEKIRWSTIGAPVMPYEFYVKIILAPSAAGKSYWLKKNPEFKDGDRYIDWPKELFWWRNPSLVDAMGKEIWKQASKWSPESIYLFNGDPSLIPVNSKIYIMGVVLPPWSIHKRNIDYRRSQGFSYQPTLDDEILGNRRMLIKYAKDKGITIYKGFNSMRAHILSTYIDRLKRYHKHSDEFFVNLTIKNIVFPDGKMMLPRTPHRLGIVIMHITMKGRYYHLKSKKDGISPFGAWIRDGETPNQALNRQSLNEFKDFKIVNMSYSETGDGSLRLYQTTLNVNTLPEPKSEWEWVEVQLSKPVSTDYYDTFGTHISLRIHTNKFASFLKINDIQWKHMVRFIPQLVILRMIGYSPTVHTEDGFIRGIKLNGTHITPSGHMLNGLIWLAFPDLSVPGMPMVYPDMHTFVSEYLLNQYTKTSSIEQFNSKTAYHRYFETAAGVLGSYVAIKMLMSKGIKMLRRDFILWRLYSRKILRSVVINSRTSYMEINSSREDDKRFGIIT